MKPEFSLGPEPPTPRRKVDWVTIAALLVTGLLVGMTLYRLQRTGALSEETFLAAVVFVTASASGILIAMERARRAHRETASRFEEVPPPLDIHQILPPDWNWIVNTPAAKRERKRPNGNPVRSMGRTGCAERPAEGD